MPQRTIHLQPLAPAKQRQADACNGCGVCCAVEPCPLGRWLSRRLQGQCRALVWDDTGHQYRCGALQAPGRWMPALPPGWARALAGRWIAAGRGCDCDFEVCRDPRGPRPGPA